MPEILFERPKMGFGVPVGQWLRGPLKDWAADLLAQHTLASDGIFDPTVVQAYLGRASSGSRQPRAPAMGGPDVSIVVAAQSAEHRSVSPRCYKAEEAMNDLLPTLLVAFAGAALVWRLLRWAISPGAKVGDRVLRHARRVCLCPGPAGSQLVRRRATCFSTSVTEKSLSAMMERDPARVIPEVTALLLHQTAQDYPLWSSGPGQ